MFCYWNKSSKNGKQVSTPLVRCISKGAEQTSKKEMGLKKGFEELTEHLKSGGRYVNRENLVSGI